MAPSVCKAVLTTIPGPESMNGCNGLAKRLRLPGVGDEDCGAQGQMLGARRWADSNGKPGGKAGLSQAVSHLGHGSANHDDGEPSDANVQNST